MQLTHHTDLALRILLVLARGDGTPLSLPAFASQQDVSYNHVAKVGQSLVHEGFAVTQRGRNGGIGLARAAEEITIGAVVRRLEPGFRLVNCQACRLNHDCRLSCILAEALDAFLAVLDRHTLAEAAQAGFPAFAAWAGQPLGTAGPASD